MKWVATVNRKAGVPELISDYTQIGSTEVLRTFYADSPLARFQGRLIRERLADQNIVGQIQHQLCQLFLAKVAFNMLADKSDEGGPPVLRSVPVTVQNGGLFVGPVAVAKVPPIDLPESKTGTF